MQSYTISCRFDVHYSFKKMYFWVFPSFRFLAVCDKKTCDAHEPRQTWLSIETFGEHETCLSTMPPLNYENDTHGDLPEGNWLRHSPGLMVFCLFYVRIGL